MAMNGVLSPEHELDVLALEYKLRHGFPLSDPTTQGLPLHNYSFDTVLGRCDDGDVVSLAWTARIAHAVSSRLKYLAMFIAYFDESGHPSDSQVLTVAVLVSKANRWETFEDKWSKRLRRANVPMFHMTDFENRKGQFAGWDNRKRTSFITDLAAIVKNSIQWGIVHSLVIRDWNAVVDPNFADEYERKRGPYIFLLQSCLEDMVKNVKLPASEKIACVFDQNNFIAGAVLTHFTLLKSAQKWDHLLGSLVFDNKARIVPLQAADMLAYESFKHITNQVIEKGQRPERLLHASLFKTKRIWAGWYDRDALTSFVKRWREDHPN